MKILSILGKIRFFVLKFFKNKVYYINGNENLPPPLCAEEEEIENDFIAILEANLSNGHEQSLESILDLIYSNQKMAKVMINNSVEESLSRRIFSLASIINYINLRRLNKLPYKNEIIFFLFSGSYALVKNWINTGFQMSPKEMAVLMNNIVNKFIN